MFIKEWIDSVGDDTGGVLLRRSINRHSAVGITTASCNQHRRWQLTAYLPMLQRCYSHGCLAAVPLIFSRPYKRSHLCYSVASVVVCRWRYVLWL